MITHLRTTITLDERLFARLKKRAAESGTTLSRLIERAVRQLLQTPAPAGGGQTFDLVTFGTGGRFSERNIDKTSALLEADDLEQVGARR